MRTYLTIISFILPLLLGAQASFRTVVPQRPVVNGESFQVQYILEGALTTSSIEQPVFSNFRFVAGPNVYKGQGELTNYVFTLEAIKAGNFFIPGAVITIEGKKLRSDGVMLRVIEKRADEITTNSDYILKPGENAWDKIRKNLFVKVTVDRKKCLVGQPVVASFKLYSRLESRSDIIKNPGFYGFTVYDMINLDDRESSVENVNGRLFDVHTIRKVQLYPLQAGQFYIDEMEIKNQVEFSRSQVNKKTEQEIIEGIVDKGFSKGPSPGSEIFETSLSTEPVVITVLPLPLKSKPEGFTGAVGNFIIESALSKDSLKVNEQARVLLTIKGKGNFPQLETTDIEWPSDVEGFEPLVKQELDKKAVPLRGVRLITYPFQVKKPGNYEVPPVSFSFYDPDTGEYKTVSSKRLAIKVDADAKATEPVKPRENAGKKGLSFIEIALLVLAGGAVFYYFMRKNRPASTEPAKKLRAAELLNTEELAKKGSIFYTHLHAAIWLWAFDHFGLKGSAMNKENLEKKLLEKRIDENRVNELMALVAHVQSKTFTSYIPDETDFRVVEKIRDLLTGIENRLL